MLKTVAGALVGAMVLAGAALPARAESGLVSFQTMTLDAAKKLAENALESCRGSDYQVSVAVFDHAGREQVLLRDRYAGLFTPEVARRKARTALNFNSDTEDMIDSTMPGNTEFGARQIPGALMLGGGVKVVAGGRTVGAVGVSGAPTGEQDAACARAGIEAVILDLEM